MKPETFVRRLKAAGIDTTAFEDSRKLTELRLVANVAKHAEGSSASELEKVRPDLFVSPLIAQFRLRIRPRVRHVYGPLSGDDLYVTPRDLNVYFEAVVGFWTELLQMVRAPET